MAPQMLIPLVLGVALAGCGGEGEAPGELADPAADPSAYLQEGDCTAVRGEEAEVLALFLDGRSKTTLDQELTALLDRRFAITLHEHDAEDLQSSAACGEITAAGS